MQKKKFTPDRSKDYDKDAHGVPYHKGNHSTRRGLAMAKKVTLKPERSGPGPKLPKKFWKKGKSKFLNFRLKEEKVKNINQLKPVK